MGSTLSTDDSSEATSLPPWSARSRLQSLLSDRKLVAPALVLIILLGATLRFWELERSPLWWDEGNNAFFAQKSLTEVLEYSRLTHDTDPPAHRVALSFWLSLWGESALALRAMSAALGLGTVYLIYLIGKRMQDRGAGLVAASLLAVSPLALTYDREAKGYSFVAFFSWLSICFLEHLCFSPPSSASRQARTTRLLWAGYALSQSLALGTHYYALLFVLAQAVWLAWELVLTSFGASKDGSARSVLLRERVLPWATAQAIAMALWVPWVVMTLDSALDGARNVPLGRMAMGLGTYLLEVSSGLALGPSAWHSVPHGLVVLGTLLLWALALLALTVGGRAERGSRSERSGPRSVGESGTPRTPWILAPVATPWRLIVCLVAVPILVAFAIQRTIPFFSVRFLLYALPAVLMLVARGCTSLITRRGWPVCTLVFPSLALVFASAVPTAYVPRVDQSEDLRPLARQLGAVATRGDGVVVGYIWQEGILRMYAPQAPVGYHLGWFDASLVGDQMAALFAQHERLWLLSYRVGPQDDANTGGRWLEAHAARASQTQAGYSDLSLYLAPCEGDVSLVPRASFRNGLVLSSAVPPAMAPAGGTLRLALAWRAERPIQQRYSVFVHLYDAAGRLWAQNDGEPQHGLRTTAGLLAGETVSDCRALPIPQNAPPGPFRLAVGLYPTGGEYRERTTTDADMVSIGEIVVEPAKTHGP